MAKTIDEVRVVKRKSSNFSDQKQKKIKLILKAGKKNEKKHQPKQKENLLHTNTDYIALSSAKKLNTLVKQKIQSDIVQLNNLYAKFSKCTDKSELIKFYMDLNNSKIDLPKPAKIIKCPKVKNLPFVENYVQKHELIASSLKLFNELKKSK